MVRLPLQVRKRGQKYYARGSIRIGRKIIRVREFSTGATTIEDAESTAHAEEIRIREQAIGGKSEQLKRLTIADCLESYDARPAGLGGYDQDRVTDFNTHIGHYHIADIKEAWQHWLKVRCYGLAPATVARFRNTLQAALNHGAEAFGFSPIKLPSVKVASTQATVYLSVEEQDKLLASYADHVKPIMTLLCFSGLRTNEALRLDWRYVRFDRREIHVAHDERDSTGPRTKSGKHRTVPMHPRVFTALTTIWASRDKPSAGWVFLTPRGGPYYDNRGKGGNPMKTAHTGACSRAQVENFTVHDWRHHWASWMVMRGADLETLRRLGGWAKITMVQRYAAVSEDHMRTAIERLV